MKKLTTLTAIALFSAQIGATPAFATEGEVLFQFYCAQCHGLTGRGDGPNVTKDFPVSPRNFTDTAEMSKLSDADLLNVIMDGGPSISKSPMMPPWGKTISEDDVKLMIVHLRGLCACEGP